MKKCTKCKIDKEVTEFGKYVRSPDGLKPNCKQCRSIVDKSDRDTWSEDQIIARKNTNKKWYLSRSKTKIEQSRKSAAIRNKARYSTDILFKLSCIIRTRLNAALKNSQKSGSAIKDLGCTIEEFKAYIESKFEPWMNWENHGPYDENRATWQLDHIRCLDNFDLTSREEFLTACNYRNYQPLLAIENLRKSNRPSGIITT